MNPEVLIVGGSLAGSACAIELQARGVATWVLERDTFPRPKVCGAFLSPGAVDCLERLSVLDEIRNHGAAPIRSARVYGLGSESRVDFRRSGIGLSRSALDLILARRAGVLYKQNVTGVERGRQGFVVRTAGGATSCRVVVDACGKLSRFSARHMTSQFGFQFETAGECSDVLEFRFERDMYGGSVSVEGGRVNTCYLVSRDRLKRELAATPAATAVTGPVCYAVEEGPLIQIGDAAGMIDPFCGEGMRHALHTGVLAAEAIAAGLGRSASYESIRDAYVSARSYHWERRRLRSALLRSSLQWPGLVRVITARGALLRKSLEWLWDDC